MAEKKELPAFETIEAEEVKAYYYNSELIQPDYELFRINSPRGRIYFRFQDRVNQLEPLFYSGSTNMLEEVPRSEYLIQWIANKGYSDAKRYMWIRMLYGSFSHSRLADLVMLGTCPLDDLPEMLKKYYYDQSFYITDSELREFGKEIQKDMIAMQQWIIDHKVRFVFSEYPVYSDIDGLGSQVDIGAWVTVDFPVQGFKKDGTPKKIMDKEPREVFALINYKSGDNFYESHRFQLEAEKNMFIECNPSFTDSPIYVFNLAATDWKSSAKWGEDARSKPYKFVNQTNEIDIDRYNAYLSLSKNTREKRLNKPITYIQGNMKLGDNPQQFIVTKTLVDLVREGTWRRFVKTSSSIPQ